MATRGPRKRRRHIRYAIKLDATLVLDNGQNFSCKIQDFCSSGFLLSFNPSSQASHFSANKKVQLHFSLHGEADARHFQLEVRVMHANSNGIGVFIENMPAEIFNALKNEVFKSSGRITDDHAESIETKQHQDNSKQIKIWLDEEMVGLLNNFFVKLDGDFKESVHKITPSALEDLITTLKFNYDSITSEFCNSVFVGVDNMACLGIQENRLNDGALENLSLVEMDDFEDWLNLSAVIRRLTKRFDYAIIRINNQLKRLFGHRAHDVKNPISPDTLCDHFRELILQLNLDITINQKLYLAFENVLTDDLETLYENFECLLSKLTAPKPAPSQVTKQPEQIAIENGYLGDPVFDFYNNNGKTLGNLFDVKEDVNLKKPKAGEASKKLLDQMHQNQPHSGTAASARSVESQEAFTAEEVISIISKIYKNTNPGGKNESVSSVLLHKLIQDKLSDTHATPAFFSNQDVQNIKVHETFFDTLFNDVAISTEIKAYMERMQLSLLEQTLQGNNFLSADPHPIRNILNQLASLESAVKENRLVKRTPVKNTLDKLVLRILQEANTNSSVFAEVDQELKEVTQQIKKSADLAIKRIIEPYEGHQLLEITRRHVQHEINRRIAGKAIPNCVLSLLDSGWQHLLVLLELDTEKSTEEKSANYQVIDDLIRWLSFNDAGLEAECDAISQTIAFIDETLDSVAPNAFNHFKVIEDLRRCLIGADSLAERKRLETVYVERLIEPECPTNKSSSMDLWALQVEQLQVGEWITLFKKPDLFVPLKLVWKGEFPEILVFVDSDGLNKTEMTTMELTEQLRNGGANTIENPDEPLMDRTTQLMLQRMHEKLIYNATHDAVTGLLTRDEFIKQLKYELAKQDASQHLLCHLKILDFRMLTNVCGLEAGNQLLVNVTHILTGQLTNNEILARLGDKTFGILIKNCTKAEGFDRARLFVNLITATHFDWENKSFPINVSVGLAPYSENGLDVQQFLQQAVSACIYSESAGHNHIKLFSEEDKDLRDQHQIQEFAGQIDKVLSENRLFLRCQKIVAIETETNSHLHYEILLGIKDETGNAILPDHFIPAVEWLKRMPDVDQWVITHVFNWIEENRAFFDQIDGFAINLSGQSLNSQVLLEFLTRRLDSCTFPVEKLTFEITETVAADSFVHVKNFIHNIKAYGCRFSLDDFGSGYSSYAYLKNLNVDYLKIDGAFVKDMAENKADVAIVKSMNEIAHSLGMKTIAEYVESNEINAILRDIGVDFAQGYFIEKPKLLSELVSNSELGGQSQAQETLAVKTMMEPQVDELTEQEVIATDSALDDDKKQNGGEGLLESDDFWGF
jgi:diguanylate cyclase (GGDEF)-like protein